MMRATALVLVSLLAAEPVAAADNKWSRVQKLESGAEIVVAAKGVQAGPRIFITASADELVVMNLAVLPRSGPYGVFAENQRLGDITDIIRTIRRDDLLTIATAAGRRNRVGCFVSGAAGWVLGSLIGGILGIVGVAAADDKDVAKVLSILFDTTVVGGTIGASKAYGKCIVRPVRVIYER